MNADKGRDSVRIAILDLKWSYGIEVLTQQLSRHLGAHAEISVISARKPDFRNCDHSARHENYLNSVLASMNPFAYLRLLRKVREIEPHIVYFISPNVLNVPMVLLCKLFSSGIVISHIHDPQYSGRFIVAAAADTVALLQSRWSHRVYCWGDKIKSTIAYKFGIDRARIATFRHGPGHRTPADDLNATLFTKPPRYFSMIGTIHPRKGIPHFLQAAQIFNQRHGADAAQFLLAGSGDLTEYRAVIDRLPNLIVVNRFLQDEEVNNFLANSYASVLPYTGGVMQSSFIAIAYGNGCPVIVSNIGSLPEEVEDGRTGYVVEKANPGQIADAMTTIYTAPYRERFRDNCVSAYRKKFDWKAIADQMYQDMEIAIGTIRKDHYVCREVRESRG